MSNAEPEQIMAYAPTPILVVSSSVRDAGLGSAFEALRLGALEVMKKLSVALSADIESSGSTTAALVFIDTITDELPVTRITRDFVQNTIYLMLRDLASLRRHLYSTPVDDARLAFENVRMAALSTNRFIGVSRERQATWLIASSKIDAYINKKEPHVREELAVLFSVITDGFEKIVGLAEAGYDLEQKEERWAEVVDFAEMATDTRILVSRTLPEGPRSAMLGVITVVDGVMAIQHQQVYAIDVAVGMIREALVQQGVADNTVIIYTSDNGFFCGSHGYGSKVLPYE